jgi:hypothetical protein
MLCFLSNLDEVSHLRTLKAEFEEASWGSGTGVFYSVSDGDADMTRRQGLRYWAGH